MFNLKGKAALITGAGGVIGSAVARLFAEHGVSEMTLTDIREEPLVTVSEQIKQKSGLQCMLIGGDIRGERNDADLIGKAAGAMHGLDILVNCASVSRPGGALDVTEAQWDTMYDTNVKGAYFLCREAMRHMERSGGGCVVNLSSYAARAGGIMITPDYPASKAAVIAITKSLAIAGAKSGIRVNTVSTGLIATDTVKALNFDPQSVPLGRIGTGEDVAGACLFLVSDYASYITGACLDVNGGISMI